MQLAWRSLRWARRRSLSHVIQVLRRLAMATHQLGGFPRSSTYRQAAKDGHAGKSGQGDIGVANFAA